MRRGLVVLLLTVCLCLAAFGQAKPNQPAKPQENSFVTWARGAWKTVQEEGKAGADRIAKVWPQKLKEVKATIATANKQVRTSIDRMNLQQKRDMLVELWSIRKSLDIMALLNPEFLHNLTGIDESALKSMEVQVEALISVVKRKEDGLRPGAGH